MTLLRSSRAVLLRLATPVALLPWPVHLLSKPIMIYLAGGSLKVTYTRNVQVEPTTSDSSCTCNKCTKHWKIHCRCCSFSFWPHMQSWDGKNEGMTQA